MRRLEVLFLKHSASKELLAPPCSWLDYWTVKASGVLVAVCVAVAFFFVPELSAACATTE